MSERQIVIGADVGGTFTDLFFLNEVTGECATAKVPSVRANQSQGILSGVALGPAALTDVSLLVHGTTVATNALLERKGARTGMITTAGFRDVIEMRRRDRPDTWGLWGMFDPVIPRDMRLEVNERVLADGTLHTPIDAGDVKAAAQKLLENGAASVCIFFINSYANQENERAAAAAVRSVWPNPHVTMASEILPEIREFERSSTASLNAYLQPPVGDYLELLETGLTEGGLDGNMLIVQSNGGVMSVETARSYPVHTAYSGPAAGVIAGAHIGISAGYPNLITCDMGGTSFDVSLVANGESALAAQTSVDFGLVIRTPMIEITTIGAGGGSIAWVDRGGILQIGPESAGSDPGPVCYGLGNDRPTVTDANLVLGRINGEKPIGGALERLDMNAAKCALENHVAAPLGMDVMTAAEAVIRVANSRMAGAIRLVSVERGHNPEAFVAMPFGGGGALHTGALIKEVGLSKALVPRYPGVTSALGCVIADMRFDRVHTINVLLDQLNLEDFTKEILVTVSDGEARLRESHAIFEGQEHIIELDMLYVGQTHTVSVRLPVQAADVETTLRSELILEAFEATYQDAYGRLLVGLPVRIMNLKIAVIGKRPKFDLSVLGPSGTASVDAAKTGEREIWVDGAWCTATVYQRLELPENAIVPGPALLEQPDTTIFIDPDLEGNVDRYGNLVIARKTQ